MDIPMETPVQNYIKMATSSIKFENFFELIGYGRNYEFNKIVMMFRSAARNRLNMMPLVKLLGDLDWVEYKLQLEQRIGSRMSLLRWPFVMLIDGYKIKFYEEIIEYIKNDFPPCTLDFIAPRTFERIDPFYLIDTNPNRNYVYLKIAVETNIMGRLIIETFNDICPKECCLFLTLCTNHMIYDNSIEIDETSEYKGAKVTRIINEGWIQFQVLGQVSSDYGVLRDSVHGEVHNKRGMVSLLNVRPNVHSVDFCISLNSFKGIDSRYITVGRVIEDNNILNIVEQMPTRNTTPLNKIEIVKTKIIETEQKEDIFNCLLRGKYTQKMPKLPYRLKAKDSYRYNENIKLKRYPEYHHVFEGVGWLNTITDGSHLSKMANDLMREFVMCLSIEIIDMISCESLQLETIDLRDISSMEFKIDRFARGLYSLPSKIFEILLNVLYSFQYKLNDEFRSLGNKVMCRLTFEYSNTQLANRERAFSGILAALLKCICETDNTFDLPSLSESIAESLHGLPHEDQHICELITPKNKCGSLYELIESILDEELVM